MSTRPAPARNGLLPRLVLLAALLAAIAPSAFVRRAAADEFEPRTFRDPGGGTLPYRLFKPRGFDPRAEVKYPLVLSLHGAGERGTDNTKQVNHARVWAAPRLQAEHPCFVVAPQCPEDRRWVEVDWGAKSHDQPEEPSIPMGLVLDLIPALRREFPIDASRIYVTGLSMGGYGTWDLLARRPDWFAAAVPICGGADTETARKIAGVPTWVFHGDADNVVPVSRSRRMVAALKAAGGAPKYTEFAGVGHNSWDAAYGDPALAPWLFSQRRRDP